MKKVYGVLGVAVVAGAIVAGCALVGANEDVRLPEGEPTPAPEGEGWTDLFAMENMDGWQNVTDNKEGVFTIENGVFHVIGQKPTRYIAFLPQAFDDFKLHVEFKLTESANSGIFFRTDPDNPVQAGFEIQVLDGYQDPPTNHTCGALYDVVTPMFNMVRPTGEWNSLDIECMGSELKVWCNGWMIIHTDLAKMTMPIGKFDTPLAELPEEGHIILQNHGDEAWFRNLLVKSVKHPAGT